MMAIFLLVLQMLCVPGSACFPVSTAVSLYSSSVTRTDSTEKTKKPNERPLSGSYDTTSCDAIYAMGISLGDADGEYALAADTLKYYIEHCYNDPSSGQAFPNIVSYTKGDSAMVAVREWLKKVLYLNPDTFYYCQDAASMIATIEDYGSGPRGFDIAGWIVIEKYLAESGKCPYLQAAFEHGLPELYHMWYRRWVDTVKDSLATPFDTTLPTLQQIGFEILLGPQYQAAHIADIPTSVLGAISATPNPFDAEVEIRYTLNVPATLTVVVFDLLGNKVATLVPGTMTQNGAGTLKLAGLSPGSYYVRFSVPEGEVRTIKVMKE
jgi:hypothetical protein